MEDEGTWRTQWAHGGGTRVGGQTARGGGQMVGGGWNVGGRRGGRDYWAKIRVRFLNIRIEKRIAHRFYGFPAK